MADDDTLLEFPCDFAIKAMGVSGEAFEAVVMDIVSRHAPDVDRSAVRSRPSRNGKYVAITVTIRAHSKQQIDAIYMELSAHQQVLMAL